MAAAEASSLDASSPEASSLEAEPGSSEGSSLEEAGSLAALAPAFYAPPLPPRLAATWRAWLRDWRRLVDAQVCRPAGAPAQFSGLAACCCCGCCYGCCC